MEDVCFVIILVIFDIFEFDLIYKRLKRGFKVECGKGDVDLLGFFGNKLIN